MFSDPSLLLWLIPGLPLASAIVTALLGPKLLKSRSHVPTVVATAGSFVLSVIVLVTLLSLGKIDNPQLKAPGVTWFTTHLLPGNAFDKAGALEVAWQLQADSLTAVMLIAITFVGTWIAIFSSGIYARRSRLSALFRDHESVLVFNDRAGARGQFLSAFCLLGRRGAVQLSTDWVLV